MTISPAMTDLSIEFRPNQLADAVRLLLDASPSDLWQTGAGTLRIERAVLPVYQLQSTSEIVLTIIPMDDKGERLTRGLNTVDEIDLGFSIQKRISDPQSLCGLTEVNEAANFAQRCLTAAFVPITDARGQRYSPLRYQRSIVDETLVSWNQFTIVWSITYKLAV